MAEKGRIIEMNEADLKKREKYMQRNAAVELASYRKRLKEGVELKRLQVEELELDIRYYDAKRKWLDLQPQVDELEAEEQAKMQEARRKQDELIAKQREEAMKAMEEKEEKKKKVELTTVKHGKPRGK